VPPLALGNLQNLGEILGCPRILGQGGLFTFRPHALEQAEGDVRMGDSSRKLHGAPVLLQGCPRLLVLLHRHPRGFDGSVLLATPLPHFCPSHFTGL
jgi:hypothetical protein